LYNGWVCQDGKGTDADCSRGKRVSRRLNEQQFGVAGGAPFVGPQSCLWGAIVNIMSHELNALGAFTPFGLSAVPTPSGDPLGQDYEARYFLFESEASEHRLDATALGSSMRDEVYQSKIGLGADGVFAAVNAEEEIFVHRNTVVWSSGGCVRKSFTLSRTIIQAMLVNFHMAESRMEDSTDKPAYASDLCMLHSGTS